MTFFGRPTVRIESESVWLEALAGHGPRIVRFGLQGGEDVFAETPDFGWDTPEGRYENVGGHRLWFAPETLGPGVPDGGLTVEQGDRRLRLEGRQEGSGLRRRIDVRLEPDRPAVTAVHEVANEGDVTFELSAWAITQLNLGGIALLPQPEPVAEHALVPNRQVVLWPYSSWQDKRLMIADGLVALDAQPDRPVKIGCLSHGGTIAYLRAGLLFVKRFEPAADSPHPDLGCNVEVYCDQGSIELETLGPLVRLEPGGTVRHEERWELRRVDAGIAGGPAALHALVEGLAG